MYKTFKVKKQVQDSIFGPQAGLYW